MRRSSQVVCPRAALKGRTGSLLPVQFLVGDSLEVAERLGAAEHSQMGLRPIPRLGRSRGPFAPLRSLRGRARAPVTGSALLQFQFFVDDLLEVAEGLGAADHSSVD